MARLNSVDDEISEDVDSVMQIYLQAVYIRLQHEASSTKGWLVFVVNSMHLIFKNYDLWLNKGALNGCKYL